MAKSLTLILLSDKEPKLATTALAAAREIDPQATIRAFDSLTAAMEARSKPGVELFLVHERDAGLVAEALDEWSLPKWGVVVLGRSLEPGRVSLPLEEWSHHALVRAFQAAIIQHELQRDLARARGDLKTICRRLTHDLRAHVGGILTTAEALQESIAENPDPAAVKPLIDSTTDTMKLIDRISFVVRASAIPKPREPLDMGMASWAAIQRLEAEMLQKGVSLVQPRSWPAVAGVSPWLEVVWWNLLDNSLQQKRVDNRIELGWGSNPSAGSGRGGNEALFWVEDSGPGVPEDKRGLLFHPFHLLHQTNAPNGLGLSIVARLVELQGGRCCYERVNDRTRFGFTLPA